jgi:hypothetical protein
VQVSSQRIENTGPKWEFEGFPWMSAIPIRSIMVNDCWSSVQRDLLFTLEFADPLEALCSFFSKPQYFLPDLIQYLAVFFLLQVGYGDIGGTIFMASSPRFMCLLVTRV